MKIRIVFLLLFFLSGGAAAEPVDGLNASVLRFGVSTRTFPDGNRNDILAALKVWANTVIKERKIQQDVQIALYDSVEALQVASEQGDFDAVSLTVEETMRLGLQPDFIYLPVQDHGFHVRYVLVVHRDGPVTDLAGLMNHGVAFSDNPRMVLAVPWLESLLAGVAGQQADRRSMNLITADNQSKAILQVYFRQVHCALVTLEAYQLAGELNPQLRNTLKVLYESPPFISAFFVFRPGYRDVDLERIKDAVLNLHTTPGGQQVLTVFQSSRMERQPGSVLDATRRFILEYRRLAHESTLRDAQP